MPLYTVILDFAGGTYISQLTGKSPKAAAKRWAQSLIGQSIQGLGEKTKQKLVDDWKYETPTAVEGVSHVWCASFLARGKLGLLHLVQTCDAPKNSSNQHAVQLDTSSFQGEKKQ